MSATLYVRTTIHTTTLMIPIEDRLEKHHNYDEPPSQSLLDIDIPIEIKMELADAAQAILDKHGIAASITNIGFAPVDTEKLAGCLCGSRLVEDGCEWIEECYYNDNCVRVCTRSCQTRYRRVCNPCPTPT